MLRDLEAAGLQQRSASPYGDSGHLRGHLLLSGSVRNSVTSVPEAAAPPPVGGKVQAQGALEVTEVTVGASSGAGGA